MRIQSISPIRTQYKPRLNNPSFRSSQYDEFMPSGADILYGISFMDKVRLAKLVYGGGDDVSISCEYKLADAKRMQSEVQSFINFTSPLLAESYTCGNREDFKGHVDSDKLDGVIFYYDDFDPKTHLPNKIQARGGNLLSSYFYELLGGLRHYKVRTKINGKGIDVTLVVKNGKAVSSVMEDTRKKVEINLEKSTIHYKESMADTESGEKITKSKILIPRNNRKSTVRVLNENGLFNVFEYNKKTGLWDRTAIEPYSEDF